VILLTVFSPGLEISGGSVECSHMKRRYENAMPVLFLGAGYGFQKSALEHVTPPFFVASILVVWCGFQVKNEKGVGPAVLPKRLWSRQSSAAGPGIGGEVNRMAAPPTSHFLMVI